MADDYWAREPPLHPSAGSMQKRPRPDPDFLPHGASYGHESFQFLPRDDDHVDYQAAKDTQSIEASYERYLQNQMSSVSGGATNFSGGASRRSVSRGLPDPAGGMHNFLYEDSVSMSGQGMRNFLYEDSGSMSGPGPRAIGGDMLAHSRDVGFDSQLPVDHMIRPGPPIREISLPPDASSTLFVEGLPREITEREVAHIFRPFVGYKEVRIVKKEPKFRNADRLILCFVDFTSAVCAATAINALQGYKMDERDPKSPELRLQFARYPTSKPSHGSRSRR